MRATPGHLDIEDNELYIGGVRCVDIAEKYETPTYVYNTDEIMKKFHGMKDSLQKYADRDIDVYYAVKANFNREILKVLVDEGSCADVVSLGEAALALDCGFPSSKILFTGTSVPNEVMMYLLDQEILINVDSFSQMRRLSEIVPRDHDIDISIRWNPGEGAGFNPKVITAGPESHGQPVKFGIEEGRMLEACEEAVRRGLRLVGLHQHIGSGWVGEDVYAFQRTIDSTLAMVDRMTKFLGYGLEFVDFGGGAGIPYRPEDKEFPIDLYTKSICDRVKAFDVDVKKIYVESGRYIVGGAGILLTEVNTVEEKSGNLIVGVDAGFNTLIRPAFYGAYHEVVVANRVDGPKGSCTIAGPLCETGDLLAVKRHMTVPEEGDILAILDAGAYGFSMASRYNMQPLPAEVIVPDNRIVTEKETYNDLVRNLDF